MRVFVSCVLGSALLLSSAPSRADETANCLESYDKSQRLRREGKLRATREELLICAQARCPAAVVKECTAWLSEVNASLPSVVFGARDEHGVDLVDVVVRSKQQLLTEQMDGREVLLDPGPQTFEFEFPGGKRVKLSLVIHQGQKNRLVVAELPAEHPAAPPAPRAATPARASPKAAEQAHTGLSVPAGAVVLGSLALVAFGTSAYLGLDAKDDLDELRDDCAPDCPQDRVDSARRQALIADVLAGAGVVSAAAAVYWFVDAQPRRRVSVAVSSRSLLLGVVGRF